MLGYGTSNSSTHAARLRGVSCVVHAEELHALVRVAPARPGRARAARRGSGPHQVAQTFTTTTFPRRSESATAAGRRRSRPPARGRAPPAPSPQDVASRRPSRLRAAVRHSASATAVAMIGCRRPTRTTLTGAASASRRTGRTRPGRPAVVRRRALRDRTDHRPSWWGGHRNGSSTSPRRAPGSDTPAVRSRGTACPGTGRRTGSRRCRSRCCAGHPASSLSNVRVVGCPAVRSS